MGRDVFKYPGIKWILASLAVLTVIQGAMIIVMARSLSRAITDLFHNHTFASIMIEIGLFAGAYFLRHLLNVIKKQIVYRYAAKMATDMREAFMDSLFLLGPRFARKEGTGKIVTMVMEGVADFRRYLELFLPKFINMAIIPAMIWIYVLFEDRTSALILFITFPILILFLIILGLAAKKQADSQFESYRILSNHFVDSLKGLETLKYLGISHSHEQSIAGVSERYRKATMKTLRVAFMSSFALDFFTMLSIAIVALFLGLGLIGGSTSLVVALAVLILSPEYFLPVRELGSDYHATLDGQEAGRNIQQIIREAQKAKAQAVAPELPAFNEDTKLNLNGLTVIHEEAAEPTLQDISLDVQGYEKIGVIGATGAGKSTFIDVVSGFLNPSSGTTALNQTPFAFSDSGWQKQVTYIPQHPYLFHLSIKENIRFYQPEASDEQVKEAARAAGLEELILSLPERYETVVGESGRMLSGGQEQRIAMARAFLSGRSIILLDEPTAHLDIETEYELKTPMIKLFENRLVFLATHRLHWMMEMDRIIVMDNGQIVEIGSHEELLAKAGYYYRLVQAELEEIE